MTVRFHRLAKRELLSALDWYRERNLDVAIRFQTAVELAVSRIGSDAEALPIESGRFRWVRVQRFPYRLIFERLGDGTILVIAFVHARRRPDYWRHRS